MYDFLIINDVRQYLNSTIFGGGPWIHLATITIPIRSTSSRTSPYREFLCIKNEKTNNIYIEELDLTKTTLLLKIKDDSLFNELSEFLTQKGIIGFGINKEFKVAKKKT